MTMKKRKDNKGRVLKEGESLRKDGRYQYRYNTIDNKRKTVYAKTLEELREKEQEIQSDIYNGFCTADRDITIQQMFVRCETVRKSLKPKTKMTYEYCYNRYAKDILGNKKVRDIKYSDMVLFFRYLLDEVHLKFGAVDMVYYPLVHVFKTAVRDNIILFVAYGSRHLLMPDTKPFRHLLSYSKAAYHCLHDRLFVSLENFFQPLAHPQTD